MCAVSMITDHYRDLWPVQPLNPLAPYQASKIHITLEQYHEYQKLKKAAEEYDTRTKQPDCVKPAVADWEKAIEDVLVKRGLLIRNG